MRHGQPSRTAEHNALFRTLESGRTVHRRLLDDPFGRRFLSWPLSIVARLAAIPGGSALAHWLIDRRWPGVRTSVIARTRLIDDAIEDSINAGRRQVVVLGAGFDSRPHRLAALRSATVFEVDHPDTQRAKRERLAGSGPQARQDVRYVAADFASGRLGDAMDAAGYDDTVPTLIVWEGVTNYLTPDAVDSTLRWCSAAARGSILIFTFVDCDVLTDPGKYLGTDQLARSLARAGEQLTFGIDPDELREYLVQRGLQLESQVGAAEYRQRYFGQAARRMRGHEFYRVAIAHVAVA